MPSESPGWVQTYPSLPFLHLHAFHPQLLFLMIIRINEHDWYSNEVFLLLVPWHEEHKEARWKSQLPVQCKRYRVPWYSSALVGTRTSNWQSLLFWEQEAKIVQI